MTGWVMNNELERCERKRQWTNWGYISAHVWRQRGRLQNPQTG